MSRRNVSVGKALPSEPQYPAPPAAVTITTETTGTTFHSVGIKWDVDGADAGHNAEVRVFYKKINDSQWSQAMNLIRSTYSWYWSTGIPEGTNPTEDCFAGSIMFLTPGETYDLWLQWYDPDDLDPLRGNYQTQFSTRAIPVKPTGGATWYVNNSGANGDGSSGSPFNSIANAQAAASAGDRIKIRTGTGTYPVTALTKSGGENNWIVYEPDTGHTPTLDGFQIQASHIWIDGLDFVWNDPTSGGTPPGSQPWPDTSAIYEPGPGGNNPDDLIVSNCTFTGFHYGVHSYYPLSRWVIMDNTLVGSRPVDIANTGSPGSSNGVGIGPGGEQKPGGPGCVIAYNSITRFVEGYGLVENSDVYGNQVWDLEDDSGGCDWAWENVRSFGNRLQYVGGYLNTFQPQKLGPWYYCYNQYADGGKRVGDAGMFKFRVQDRMVFVNNTFYNSGCAEVQQFARCFTRNNLHIAGAAGAWLSTDNYANEPNPALYREAIWDLPGDSWQNDSNYDGWDWGGTGNPFSWNNNSAYYSSIAAWNAVSNMQANGIEVSAAAIFNTIDTGNAFQNVSPTHALTLKSGANAAVDAGEAVHNIADFYSGTAPDLGCHDRGNGPLHFGPREAGELSTKTEHWSKH